MKQTAGAGATATTLGAGSCSDFGVLLRRLADRQDLTCEEASFALDQIVEGTVGEAEAAALLMGLRLKGETDAEIAGFADAMRRLAVRVETPASMSLVDIVGTGGDALGTFNISTTAALVVAGAGAKVAKHGNRAASSRCGSADVLRALGVCIELGPQGVSDCIEKVGMGFMLASVYHPSMARVMGIRRALGIRTVFNFLGPLTNPAGARRLLLGVSAEDYLDVLAAALARTGCVRSLVVHGDQGMDELSITGPSQVVEVAGGRVGRRHTIEPETYGLSSYPLAAVIGGDPAENAAITRGVLSGWAGAPRDAVLLNAGAALYVSGTATSIAVGVELARDSLDSGRAGRVLETLVLHSRKLAAERS